MEENEVVEEQEEQEPVNSLTAKEIMLALWKVMPTKESFGSKKLAKLAGLEYEDRILKILHALKDAGKAEFEEGKWRKKAV